MSVLPVAIATLLCSTLFSAPLLAERHQTHTMTGNMGNMSHMSNMSHSMQSGMNLDMSSMIHDRQCRHGLPHHRHCQTVERQRRYAGADAVPACPSRQ
ncbi:hypothetical protein [Dickeya dianthicola]|uniref:hypothetical protein n=1 Tax=Dickeya dianthicola TaxID=204039 RepID=UPI0013C52139|nr:hypothetical protein [Dickeya dianthicola]MBT1427346.1 hypothetical protein [Dickeya dianthicola]MBT1458865.1 hypothetical protein [Dickeya dianthicola]MBT1488063.1 hypothetical protein [Dickeya dianthicola]MCI4003319.1 hypothetical protein [Dickeya dianthicola]MCI4029743.1 hypothetical protein [Dickeya dianthicola]